MGATISDCGRYRYTLTREWLIGAKPGVTFIMLNPSTADAAKDDPTIRRCIGFAKTWGYGALTVVNLFAWRATDPRELLRAPDPVGRDNGDAIRAAAAGASLVVAAWGDNSRLPRAFVQARVDEVVRLLALYPLHAIHMTRDGFPRHPLYLPASLDPVEFTPAWPVAGTKEPAR